MISLVLVTGCADGLPNELSGSLAEVFDLGFDHTRARAYASELAVEYVDLERSGRVALRVTLSDPETLERGAFDVVERGFVGLADEVGAQLPPLVDGEVVITAWDPSPGGPVAGTFRATHETADGRRLAVYGAFDAALEVIDADPAP